MIKKFLVALLLTLFLTVTITTVITYKKGGISPQFCADMICVGDYLYSIDMDANRNMKIFRCLTDGTQAVAIEQSLASSDYELCYNYGKLTCDPATGEIYVYKLESYTLTGMPVKEEIMHCNFTEQTLEPFCEIQPPAETYGTPCVLAFQMNNNMLQYLSETPDGYTVYTQNAEDTQQVRQIAVCDEVLFYTMKFDGHGNITAFSDTSGLYYENDEHVLQAVSGKNGEWGSYANPILEADFISCVDLTSNHQITYFLQTGKTQDEIAPLAYHVTNAEEAESNSSIFWNELTNHCYISENAFAAYVELPYSSEIDVNENVDYDSLMLPDFRYALAVQKNGQMHLYPEISYDKDYLKKYVLGIFGMIELGFFIILMIGFSFYILIQKTGFVSLRLQIGVYSLLVFGSITALLAGWVNILMQAVYETNYEYMLYSLEKDMAKEMDILIENIPDFTEETLYSEEFYNALWDLPNSSVFLNEVTGQEELGLYYLLHIPDENGEFQIIYNGGSLERVPSSVLYHNFYTDQVYEKVMQTRRSSMGQQCDSLGQWYVDIFCYENEQYHFNAIVEIGIDYYKVYLKCLLFRNDILRLIIACCIILMIVIQVYLNINLAPIKKLGIQVEKGLVEKPHSRRLASEILIVWERLYVMINNAWQRQREAEKNNQQHYSFISGELISLLNLENLSEAEAGKQRQCSLHILHAVFQEPTPEKMQLAYAHLTETIAKLDGILLHMHMGHVVWIFQHSNKNVLRAAQEILQTAKKYHIQCGVGIGSGINTVSVCGAKEYAEIIVSGWEYDESERLAKKAALKDGCCFLTHSAKSLVNPVYWRTEEKSSEESDNTWFVLFSRTEELSAPLQEHTKTPVSQI